MKLISKPYWMFADSCMLGITVIHFERFFNLKPLSLLVVTMAFCAYLHIHYGTKA